MPVTPAPSALPRPPIAVVGVSALFPGSADETGFWHDLLSGRDLLGPVPPDHWLVEDYYDPDPTAPDRIFVRRGAFLDPVDFDPLAWGIPPSIVPATDTAQLLALIVAQRVLGDATAGQFASMDRSRVSVILGVTSAQELLSAMVGRLQRPIWVKALREAGLPETEVQSICDRMSAHYVDWQESTFPGLLGNVVAGRIANRLDLGGTNCVTDAACASSFSALQMGINELYLGQSDLVISGGVDTMNDIFMYMCFCKTHAMSASEDCRPFSDRADGTMLGEGLAMVALKRLEDAEAAGDRIYALIRGVGAGSDGRAKSIYAPLAAGQARAIRRAYHEAGYGPDTVELMEAHGTATRAGDAAEFEALTEVYDDSGRSDRQWCSLGSVKSQIGHTKATAGAVGLFKTIMAVHGGVLPPTLKIDRPNPKLELDRSPFHLNTRCRPWVRGSDHPRRASVSSFGFGGSNFHVTLEEYRGSGQRAPRLRATPCELVAFGDDGVEGLLEQVERHREVAAGSGHLAWLSASGLTEVSGTRPARRVALVATDGTDLERKLGRLADHLRRSPEEPLATPDGAFYGLGEALDQLGFLFPGQGSQFLDMGAELAMHFRQALAVWDRAADLFADAPLHRVVFPHPAFSDEEREAQERLLTATEWAQPAIGAVSLSMMALLTELGLEPVAVAGHSFGEITALAAAGALDPDDFLRVARRRGELMGSCRESGAMTAVAAPLERVRAAVDRSGAEVVVANHNAPEQVVLSGSVAAVERVETALSADGLNVRRLPVATAFHSSIVAAAVEPFASFLEGIPFSSPRIPVFANAEAAAYPAEPDEIRSLLSSSIARPVRFVDEVEAMYAAGVRTFVEVGPGAVLTGLVRQILGDETHLAVSLDRRGKGGLEAFFGGIATLWAAGHPLRLEALWEGYRTPLDPSEQARPRHAIAISGTNWGKPYPPPGGAAALPPPNPPRVEPEPRPAATAVDPSAPPPQPVPAQPTDPAWVAAFQEAQRQTADAHVAYQQSMAQTHQAFLRTAETALNGLATMLGGATPTATASPSLPAPVPVPAPGPDSLAPAAPAAPPKPAPETVLPPEPAPAAQEGTPDSGPDTATGAAAPDLGATLLEVVAEATGYPADMLMLEMDLEGDLGVDSIKRVEILSALRDRIPGLPTLEPAQLGKLQTLHQIVEALAAFAGPMGASEPAPAAVPEAPPAAAGQEGVPDGGPGSGPEADATDLGATLLEVVADATGYPVDMLMLEMDLEGDLGVDSIKRVEILSALRDRIPDLPTLEPAQLGKLHTLGQIADALRGHGDPAAPSVPLPVPVPDSPPPPRVGRWSVELEEAPPLGMAPPGLREGGRTVVLDGGSGLGEEVVAALVRSGVRAELTERIPVDATGVVCLAGLRDLSSVDDALRLDRELFALTRDAGRILVDGGTLVLAFDAGGDLGFGGTDPVRSFGAGATGLAKTAAREWVGVTVRAIDLERGDRNATALADALVSELLNGGPEVEVGIALSGRRVRPRLVRGAADGSRLDLDEGSVVVVTGGARGVTAACLLELSRRARPRLAILGRTPLEAESEALAGVPDAELRQALVTAARAAGDKPTPAEVAAEEHRLLAAREVRRNLAALEDAGATVRYLEVDARDRVAVAEALAAVRTAWGPVHAVIHGAGVIADRLLVDTSDESFERVFATKVEGLRALLDATAGDPLGLLCLFSSVAGRTGNVGQSSYAMANEVLAKVAAGERRRRGSACLVKVVDWGPWEGGMVTPELAARFAAREVPLIPLADGARALADELSGSHPEQVEVVVGAAPDVLVGPPPPLTLEVTVDRGTHPWLADHAVRGAVVLPVVLVVEWFARTARAALPGRELAAVGDLRVLRGVRLPRFDDARETFRVLCRVEAVDAPVELELRGADGTLLYTGRAELTDEPEPCPAGGPEPDVSPWGERPVYGGALFHGPLLQVVESVEGVSQDGLVADLAGLAGREWPGGPWQTDPAALDGALQLAVLWTEHVLGAASLPTRIEQVRLWARGPLGRLRGVATASSAEGQRATCDVALFGEDGRLRAELLGVETHLLPGD